MTETKKIADTTVRRTGGQWIVGAYDEEGNRMPDCDYHTHCLEDAEITAGVMVHGPNETYERVAKLLRDAEYIVSWSTRQPESKSYLFCWVPRGRMDRGVIITQVLLDPREGCNMFTTHGIPTKWEELAEWFKG